MWLGLLFFLVLVVAVPLGVAFGASPGGTDDVAEDGGVGEDVGPEPVVFSSDESGWEIPVEGLECQPLAEDLPVSNWACEDPSRVMAGIPASGYMDEEVALRRMTRIATLDLPGEDLSVVKAGAGQFLYDPDKEVISLSLRNDDPVDEQIQGELMVVVISGDEIEDAARMVWRSFGLGELPDEAEAQFARPDEANGPDEDEGELA